jgi:hypothetical protein
MFVWVRTEDDRSLNLGREYFSSGLDDGMPVITCCDEPRSAVGRAVLSFLSGMEFLCVVLSLLVSIGSVKVIYQAHSWEILSRNIFTRGSSCSLNKDTCVPDPAEICDADQQRSRERQNSLD